MTRLRFWLADLSLALVLGLSLAAPAARAQRVEAPPGPVGGAAAAAQPDGRDLRLPFTGSLQAVAAALGQGRQRLALVVGIGTVGARLAVDSAPRDTQAVAAALRAAGFVVMLREDIVGTELRGALHEFSGRLKPGGIGFVYFGGQGLQIDGQNLLLPRDAVPEGSADALAARIKGRAVPLQELVDALMGPPGSPRLLVVDAAFRHPALAGLPRAGLAEQKLPPGMMAIFGSALGVAQEVPAVAPLPEPAPTDPRQLAASRFARALVGALTTPRISGADALRRTQRAIAEATQGQAVPWVGGDSDARDEFAEASVLDALLPRGPEDFAREGVRQGLRASPLRSSGEQSVAEVLEQSAPRTVTPDLASAPAAGNEAPPRAPAEQPPAQPETPGGSPLGSAISAVGTAAGVVGSAAALAAGAKAAEVAATAAAAGALVGGASAGLGSAAALASRLGSGSPSEQPARPLAPPPAPSPSATALASASATATPPALATVGLPPAAAPAAAGPAPSQPPPPDGRTVRSANGGERPVFTPRSNSFGHAEGDTLSYQVVDTWKDEIIGSYTTAIEEVLGDGTLIANGHQTRLDAQGRLTRQTLPDGSFSQFEPAQELWWADPRAGEKRSLRFVEHFRRGGGGSGEIEFKGSSSVGKARAIETPAGTFEALPIESSGWTYQKMKNGALSSAQFSRTVWYSPQLGHPVAIDIQDADRVGKLLRRERVELMHAQQARAIP